MKYDVDVPPVSDLNSTWHHVDSFATREEAIAFVKSAFGGDDEGRICLISEQEWDNDDSE